MRANTKKFIALAAAYFALVFAPYFVPALNSATPKILGLPFTVVYITIVMFLGCGIMYWASKNVWDGFDYNMEDNTATSGPSITDADK